MQKTKKKKERNPKLIKGLLLLAVVISLLVVLNNYFDFSNLNIDYIQDTIVSYGALGPLIYIAAMTLAIIISPIPSLPLDTAAGAIWGPWLATLYSVIGAEIGAIISFLIARYFLQGIVDKALHGYISFCNACTKNSLTWIIFVSRLLPVFQFDIVSYGAGLTNIRLYKFALATFFGMIPATFVFAYFGKTLMIGSSISIIISVTLIAGIFIVPIIIKKCNLFGLRDKIHEH